MLFCEYADEDILPKTSLAFQMIDESGEGTPRRLLRMTLTSTTNGTEHPRDFSTTDDWETITVFPLHRTVIFDPFPPGNIDWSVLGCDLDIIPFDAKLILQLSPELYDIFCRKSIECGNAVLSSLSQREEVLQLWSLGLCMKHDVVFRMSTSYNKNIWFWSIFLFGQPMIDVWLEAGKDALICVKLPETADTGDFRGHGSILQIGLKDFRVKVFHRADSSIYCLELTDEFLATCHPFVRRMADSVSYFAVHMKTLIIQLSRPTDDLFPVMISFLCNPVHEEPTTREDLNTALVKYGLILLDEEEFQPRSLMHMDTSSNCTRFCFPVNSRRFRYFLVVTLEDQSMYTVRRQVWDYGNRKIKNQYYLYQGDEDVWSPFVTGTVTNWETTPPTLCICSEEIEFRPKQKEDPKKPISDVIYYDSSDDDSSERGSENTGERENKPTVQDMNGVDSTGNGHDMEGTERAENRGENGGNEDAIVSLSDEESNKEELPPTVQKTRGKLQRVAHAIRKKAQSARTFLHSLNGRREDSEEGNTKDSAARPFVRSAIRATFTAPSRHVQAFKRRSLRVVRSVVDKKKRMGNDPKEEVESTEFLEVSVTEHSQ